MWSYARIAIFFDDVISAVKISAGGNFCLPVNTAGGVQYCSPQVVNLLLTAAGGSIAAGGMHTATADSASFSAL